MAQEMARPVEALGYFERFLAAVPRTRKYAKLINNAEGHVTALKKQVATLEVVIPQRGASVFVDQRALGVGPLKKTIRLSPGRHLVSVSLHGHQTETRAVEISAGARQQTTVVLKPIPTRVKVVVARKSRVVRRMPRWLPWTILGVGVAVGLASAGPLVMAKKQFEEYDNSVAIGQEDLSLKTWGERNRSAGYAMIAIGGAIAAGGVVTLILNLPRRVPVKEKPAGSANPTLPVIVPFAGQGSWGLTFAGAF